MQLTGQHASTAPAQIRRPAARNGAKPVPAHVRYQARLRTVKNGALFVAGLQKCSRFFGICALTWATVVLLGGFASALKSLDFYLISILLLLEAARLSTIEFFSKLLTKALFREDNRPEEFAFKDLQNFWAFRLDLVGQGCSGLFAMLSLASAVVRLALSRRYRFTERDHQAGDELGNITQSLYTFYALVLLNSASGTLACVIRPFLRQSSEDSLMSYHDEVYKIAMTSGLTDADDINIFEFAFKKLASDHARNIRPITIRSRNSELIKFIYSSENGLGVTCEYLRSRDAWKQVVAAALPGFWAGESKIEKQLALFWALQDRLYSVGKVSEVAANSIHSLGKVWAGIEQEHPFLIVDPNKSNAKNVVDSVIDLILHPIRPSLLFQLRALEGCCKSSQVLRHIYNKGGRGHDELRQRLQNQLVAGASQRDGNRSEPEELCLKLATTVRSNAPIRQTTKMFAASALHALLSFGGELAPDALTCLQGMVQDKIDLADLKQERTPPGPNGPYVWLGEKEMLDNLRSALGLESFKDWHKIRVLGPDGQDMVFPAPNNGGGFPSTNCATV